MDPLFMGGMMGLQAIMGARQASASSMQNWMTTHWNNTKTKIQNDIDNMAIQANNAAQWSNNMSITEAAAANKGEESFYLRYNYDNETGNLSRNTRTRNDMLDSTLNQRNIPTGSQTAWSIKRMNEKRDQDLLVSRGINFANREKSVDKKFQGMMGKRNFGYQRSATFIPAISFEDPAAAYETNLQLGLVRAGMGMYQQGQQNAAQLPAQQLQNIQWQLYNQQLNPGWAGDPLYDI